MHIWVHCYFKMYPSDVSYNMFPGTPETFPGHIGLFPGPFLREMNQSRERFQYFHQKKSRKLINIPTKRVRRFRKHTKRTPLTKNINISIKNGPGKDPICLENVSGGLGIMLQSLGIITGISVNECNSRPQCTQICLINGLQDLYQFRFPGIS